MKLIKDPVHGYIKIQDEYVKKIVDSCEFQRLRNIRQTSYDSLYPGSSHNRFIHSLGVYYLGLKAFEALQRNVKAAQERWGRSNEIEWDQLKNTFALSCLLHDVGHTPFSHTGEDFLLIDKEADAFDIMKKFRGKSTAENYVLYNDLLSTVEAKLSKEAFDCFLENFAETVNGSTYYDGKKKVAKPHEIMSVIIAIDTYDAYFQKTDVDVDLFARAILGIRYKDSSKLESGVKNALIQLLNSNIIDVDRLDYIMRDMQMSGFDSISIDIERLLDSVTLIYNSQEQQYHFGYKKNALSTIENVVVAHDEERRWIQGHPVVMYDSFLVEKCIKAVEQQFKEKDSGKSVFQKKSLTAEGIHLDNDTDLRLMNDGDFLFLMKQIKDNNPLKYYVTEYLSRDQRKSPIWKSESEFRLLLNELSSRQQQNFLNIFTDYGGNDGENCIGSTLNKARICELKAELDNIQKDTEASEEVKNKLIRNVERKLFWLKKLKGYCEGNDMEFNIHNLRADVFQSKINELTETGVEIWYEQFQKSEKIADVLSLYSSDTKRSQTKMFYLYIKKSEQFSMKGFIDFLKGTLNEYEINGACHY